MPRKTADDWVNKGWTKVEVAPGQFVDVAYDPDTQDLNVRRQVYGADGEQLSGHGHPKVKVEHTDTGSRISTDQGDAAVTVLYRIVEEDEEEQG